MFARDPLGLIEPGPHIGVRLARPIDQLRRIAAAVMPFQRRGQQDPLDQDQILDRMLRQPLAGVRALSILRIGAPLMICISAEPSSR